MVVDAFVLLSRMKFCGLFRPRVNSDARYDWLLGCGISW